MEQHAAATVEEVQHNRYLTFVLTGETYGVPIGDVTQIVGIMPATRLPETPAYVKGLINLRGKILPVLDMRERLNKPAAEYDDKTCTIIVSIGEVTAGLIVDEVADVTTIENVIPYPAKDANCISGIAQQDGRVSYLIDCVALLGG